jgi:formylglycine-generating enzyme required for sulfatase activity
MTARTTCLCLLLLGGCTKRPEPSKPNAAPAPAEASNLKADTSQAGTASATDDGRCPEGMAHIPGGTFMLGTTPDDSRDALHQVTITKPYCIDRVPVTVAAYRRCVQANACTVPRKPLDHNYDREGRDNHPVNAVTWDQANAYCQWAKKRLPTDAEWVLAAKGTDDRKYPWGNEEPDDTRLHWSRTIDRHGTAPVGSYAAGASPYGVLDMLGNISQWLADWDGVYAKSPQVDPTGPSQSESRAIRGYAYDGGRFEERSYFRRFSRRGDFTSPTTGFRCGASP